MNIITIYSVVLVYTVYINVHEFGNTFFMSAKNQRFVNIIGTHSILKPLISRTLTRNYVFPYDMLKTKIFFML